MSDETESGAPPGKAAKPRAKYTRKLYDLLTEAYRQAPGNHQQAALYASVDRATARRAFKVGWNTQGRRPWARPIGEVLAEEARDAAAVKRQRDQKAREADDAAREAARREGVEELVEEARLRGALRKGLLGAALTLTELVPSLRLLVGVVKSAVLEADGKTPKAAPEVTPLQAMKLLKENALAVGRVAAASEQIVQLGRTIRGQANVNVAVAEMGYDEALEELEMAREVLEQSKAARAEGGAQAPDAEPPDGGKLH